MNLLQYEMRLCNCLHSWENNMRYPLLGIFVVCLVLFSSSICTALGVTPARTTIDFQPSQAHTIGFHIINSEHGDYRVDLSSAGDLREFISFNESTIFVRNTDSSVAGTYTLRLPSDLSPGLHTTDIILTQVSTGTSSSGASIGASVSTATSLSVFVPYPGKSLAASFDVRGGEDHMPVFVLPLVHQGTDPIEHVRAHIVVYSSDNSVVDEFETEDISLAPHELRDIRSPWTTSLPVGNYHATARVSYDGLTLPSLETSFSLGAPAVIFENMTTNNFHLGTIVPLHIVVANTWSESLEQTYVTLTIKDSTGVIVGNITSPRIDVPAFGSRDILVYWDTSGIPRGAYSALVTTHFKDRSLEKELHLDVEQSQLIVNGASRAVESPTTHNYTMIIIAVVLLVLLLIYFVWFFFFRNTSPIQRREKSTRQKKRNV